MHKIALPLMSYLAYTKALLSADGTLLGRRVDCSSLLILENIGGRPGRNWTTSDSERRLLFQSATRFI